MRKKMAFIVAIIIMNYSLCHVSAETVSGGDLIGGSDVVISVEVAEPVYNVTFPAKTVAWLDPDNLSGRGQIFSDEYVVENYSNMDVSIRVKNVKVFYLSTESVYEFYETGTEENSSDVKRLDVNLVWVNKSENTERVLHVTEGECDETVLVLKAAEYNDQGECIGLNEGSTGFFYFTGTLNANPNIVWEDGEVELQFDYEIVNAKSEIPEGTSASKEAETESGQADDPVQPMEEDSASSSEINSGQDGQSTYITESEKEQTDAEKILNGAGESMTESERKGEDSGSENMTE